MAKSFATKNSANIVIAKFSLDKNAQVCYNSNVKFIIRENSNMNVATLKNIPDIIKPLTRDDYRYFDAHGNTTANEQELADEALRTARLLWLMRGAGATAIGFSNANFADGIDELTVRLSDIQTRREALLTATLGATRATAKINELRDKVNAIEADDLPVSDILKMQLGNVVISHTDLQAANAALAAATGDQIPEKDAQIAAHNDYKTNVDEINRLTGEVISEDIRGDVAHGVEAKNPLSELDKIDAITQAYNNGDVGIYLDGDGLRHMTPPGRLTWDRLQQLCRRQRVDILGETSNLPPEQDLVLVTTERVDPPGSGIVAEETYVLAQQLGCVFRKLSAPDSVTGLGWEKVHSAQPWNPEDFQIGDEYTINNPAQNYEVNPVTGQPVMVPNPADSTKMIKKLRIDHGFVNGRKLTETVRSIQVDVGRTKLPDGFNPGDPVGVDSPIAIPTATGVRDDLPRYRPKSPFAEKGLDEVVEREKMRQDSLRKIDELRQKYQMENEWISSNIRNRVIIGQAVVQHLALYPEDTPKTTTEIEAMTTDGRDRYEREQATLRCTLSEESVRQLDTAPDGKTMPTDYREAEKIAKKELAKIQWFIKLHGIRTPNGRAYGIMAWPADVINKKLSQREYGNHLKLQRMIEVFNARFVNHQSLQLNDGGNWGVFETEPSVPRYESAPVRAQLGASDPHRNAFLRWFHGENYNRYWWIN